MAVCGLEQRFPPLELSYCPNGPVGVPPWAALFDEDTTEVSRSFASKMLRRSRSYAGYRTWRSMTVEEREEAMAADEDDFSADIGDEQIVEEGAVGYVIVKQYPGTCEGITTVMVKNLAPNFRRAAFIRTLEAMGFQNRFDFVHLPMQFGTSRNRGFAFVNFIDADGAREFFQKLSRHGRTKGWKVLPAVLQGLEANVTAASTKTKRVRHYRNKPLVLNDRPHSAQDSALEAQSSPTSAKRSGKERAGRGRAGRT